MLTAATRKELKMLKDAYTRKLSAIEELLDEKPGLNEVGTDPIPRGGRIKAMADAAFAALAEGDGPMRRESILTQIEADGVSVRGDTLEKKLRLLSSALSRDTRFISMGRGTGLWNIDRGHAHRISALNGQSAPSQQSSMAGPTPVRVSDSIYDGLD